MYMIPLQHVCKTEEGPTTDKYLFKCSRNYVMEYRYMLGEGAESWCNLGYWYFCSYI